MSVFNMIERKAGYASIFLKEMEVTLPIGLHDFEKKVPQRVVVSIELFVDAKSYLANVSSENIVDYAVLAQSVEAWEQRDHVELIETYLQELLPVCFGWVQVEACRISIGKPDIFECATSAGVEVFIDRLEFEALAG